MFKHPIPPITYFKWVLYIGMICLWHSCEYEAKYKQDMLALFQQEKDIQCELATIKGDITQEWDTMNRLLEENLPANMPAEEKKNMLKVRNADLIRMFESFDSVGGEVKAALSSVENKDRAMAARIVVLKEKAQQLEASKMALYEQISQQEGEKALSDYKNLCKEAVGQNCR